MKDEKSISTEIDRARLKLSIEHYIKYFIGKRACEITKEEAFTVIALAVREFAMDKMYETISRYNQNSTKRVYYLSIEYLIGRSLENNLYNLRLYDILKDIKIDGFPDISLQEIFDAEYDPALGNGGLGRLAADYLDSMAATGIPGFGYGINYQFGLFKQKFENGYQIEQADSWLEENSPWQFARYDRTVIIPIGGHVEMYNKPDGRVGYVWTDTHRLYGVPYDFPIVGFNGKSVNYLRLFSAKTDEELDLNIFNSGGYIEAVRDKIRTETISKVLYPSDNIVSGKELRLTQQYFFVSCAIQDIIRRFLEKSNDFAKLPEYVCIQLNDTHPALAIVEMMRQLLDIYNKEWDESWNIVTKVFAYTNHTLLPEALEKWNSNIIGRILPRHLQIIYEINRRFMEFARSRFGEDGYKLGKVSIVDGEGDNQVIRMANLSIVGSFSVNGVAKLHSELVKHSLVPEFYELWPEKFTNVTNGITPRRWLVHANNNLANLIADKIGKDWVTNLDLLRDIEKYSDNKAFLHKFMEIKYENKQRLVRNVYKATKVMLNPDSIYIVHAKRIHEYKRQLMTALQIIGEYLDIIQNHAHPSVPKTYIFAGKAAPSYTFAKLIIKLINNIANVINNDEIASEYLKVVFIPDYKVSVAEYLIPAADISCQVSTAGFEASGTSNMKFALNGALTIGTLDGANIEIREAVGEENFYLFGLTENEIRHKRLHYNPREIYENSDYVKRILNALDSAMFADKNYPQQFRPIFDSLLNSDYYFILADLEDFNQTLHQAEKDYNDRIFGLKRLCLMSPESGIFQAIARYWNMPKKIWHISPVE